jgi:hypothetical protein
VRATARHEVPADEGEEGGHVEQLEADVNRRQPGAEENAHGALQMWCDAMTSASLSTPHEFFIASAWRLSVPASTTWRSQCWSYRLTPERVKVFSPGAAA